MHRLVALPQKALIMSAHEPMEILKGAILLEKRGRALYKHFAETSKNNDVTNLFEMMADEEDHHIEILGKHMKAVQETGAMADIALNTKPAHFAGKIATKNIINDIEAASNEASAISAAISLEKSAVDFYRKGAEKAVDKKEKELYDWLANWEEKHMKFLADIDEELTEQIWTDNNFWPIF